MISTVYKNRLLSRKNTPLFKQINELLFSAVPFPLFKRLGPQFACQRGKLVFCSKFWCSLLTILCVSNQSNHTTRYALKLNKRNNN